MQLCGSFNTPWHCLSFEIAVNTDLFWSCGHCWVFQICWNIVCSTLTASCFRIWNGSIEIPSPPLALFIILLKAHLTSHSRISGSSWVITPLWLSGSWRSLLLSSSVYCLLLTLVHLRTFGAIVMTPSFCDVNTPMLILSSLIPQLIKNLPAMQKTQVWSLVWKIPWRRKWQHTPVFLPWKSNGERSLAGYCPWGHHNQTPLSDYTTTCLLQGFPGISDGKESACNAGDSGSIPRSGRSLGAENGYPFQYSCLENFMDTEIWLAPVYRVTNSGTWLSDWSDLNWWIGFLTYKDWWEWFLFKLIIIA